MGIVGGIAVLGWVICFIIVLIKQFQEGGLLHGIIGIITCGIWTLIWGWINAGKLNLRNLMLVWTVLWFAAIILNSMSGALSFTSAGTAS